MRSGHRWRTTGNANSKDRGKNRDREYTRVCTTVQYTRALRDGGWKDNFGLIKGRQARRECVNAGEQEPTGYSSESTELLEQSIIRRERAKEGGRRGREDIKRSSEAHARVVPREPSSAPPPHNYAKFYNASKRKRSRRTLQRVLPTKRHEAKRKRE